MADKRKCTSMGCEREPMPGKWGCEVCLERGRQAVAASRIRHRQEADLCRALGIKVPEGYDE